MGLCVYDFVCASVCMYLCVAGLQTGTGCYATTDAVSQRTGLGRCDCQRSHPINNAYSTSVDDPSQSVREVGGKSAIVDNLKSIFQRRGHGQSISIQTEELLNSGLLFKISCCFSGYLLSQQCMFNTARLGLWLRCIILQFILKTNMERLRFLKIS